ncbi:hypothetical protein D3C84_852540 [compost metagenome]
MEHARHLPGARIGLDMWGSPAHRIDLRPNAAAHAISRGYVSLELVSQVAPVRRRRWALPRSQNDAERLPVAIAAFSSRMEYQATAGESR